MRGYTSTFTAGVVIAFASAALTSATPLHRVHHSSEDGRAPLYTPPNVFGSGSDEDGMTVASAADSHLIPDSYMVILKESHAHHFDLHLDHLRSTVLNAGRAIVDFAEEVGHHYAIGDMRGYSGKFSEQSIDWIRSHPAVDFVERDSIVRTMDIERGAPWGLARISHRKSLGFSTLGKYEYAHGGGAGVDVYVIDTGINVNHVEFEGRAKWGKTMPQNDVDLDGNGHGTHCAGTIASAKYGVAKDANLIAVKVLGSGGSGSMSDVVGGVAWAAQAATTKAQSESAKNGSHKGSVANMSLGGGKSPALDLAVNNAVKKGLHFAVAAGNDNRDACNYSPAAAQNAITVGASTILDQRAYFSNIGKCVDLFAPGLNILSTWNTGNRSVNTISGTSMASPHIAGLTAYYLSLYGTGEFAPTQADYEAAGLAYPGSFEEVSARSLEGLFSRGRQLIFGSGGRKAEYAGAAAKPLDPLVLKKAMIRLSTKDALAGLPNDGTPNYLAFNNFTSSSSKSASAPAAARIEEITPEEQDLDEEMVHFQPVFDKGEAMVQDTWEMLEEIVEEMVENMSQ